MKTKTNVDLTITATPSTAPISVDFTLPPIPTLPPSSLSNSFPPPVPSASPQPPQPTQPSRRRVDSLALKARAGSFYSQLTPPQISLLCQWLDECSLTEVVRRVAAPSPEGFGIHTHTTTLQRIRTAQRAANSIAIFQEALEIAEDFDDQADLSQFHLLEKGLSGMLLEHAFTLAQTVPGSPVIPSILDSINKLSALEHKRQKLLLEREKIHLQASVPPRRHQVDLNIVRPSQPVVSSPQPRRQLDQPAAPGQPHP